MKLICDVDELCSRRGWNLARLSAETGIDQRTLSKLNAKDGSWALKREQIERLSKLAFSAGLNGFFRIEHHPVWSTFEHAETLIFRGTPVTDARVEHEVTRFLQHKSGSPRTITTPPSEAEVADAMRESNCLFVGSPRSNPATEIALCLLAGARPFDDDPANRQKLPIQIIGRDFPEGRKSAVLVPSRQRHGFEVAGGERGQPHFIRVQWRSREEYDKWHGGGEDAAMVVICRSPLTTGKDVTSILVLGYTGIATQSAASQLTEGQLKLSAEHLQQRGKAHLLAWQFRFLKPKNANPNSKVDVRTEVDGSGEWVIPPWR